MKQIAFDAIILDDKTRGVNSFSIDEHRPIFAMVTASAAKIKRRRRGKVGTRGDSRLCSATKRV